MNKANDITVVDEPYIESASTASKPRRTRRSAKAVDVLIDLGPCPRSIDEVYSLGIKMQYYIGDIYLRLNALHQGSVKTLYKELALKQLDTKKEIQKLADDNLNELLSFFYNNGGAIIEPLVSEQMAKEMQPFFNRISANFLKQVDVLVSKASKEETNASELEPMINNILIEMYTTMSMLFPIQKMKDAYNELISLR
jgi:hypothetical protein